MFLLALFLLRRPIKFTLYLDLFLLHSPQNFGLPIRIRLLLFILSFTWFSRNNQIHTIILIAILVFAWQQKHVWVFAFMRMRQMAEAKIMVKRRFAMKTGIIIFLFRLLYVWRWNLHSVWKLYSSDTGVECFFPTFFMIGVPFTKSSLLYGASKRWARQFSHSIFWCEVSYQLTWIFICHLCGFYTYFSSNRKCHLLNTPHLMRKLSWDMRTKWPKFKGAPGAAWTKLIEFFVIFSGLRAHFTWKFSDFRNCQRFFSNRFNKNVTNRGYSDFVKKMHR